jgi:prepilin-type N-terminal cleavage/methylation domain-containing protein
VSRATRREERGFTLIEMLVVLGIIGVLISIGLLSVSSARDSGGRAAAIASARAYETAIDRYAAAHGGRVPTGADWPNASADKGPVSNIMGTKKFYLPRVPETVQDGRVLVRIGTPPPTTGSVASVTYVIDGSGYRLEIRSGGRPPCALYGQGGAPNGSEPVSCG